MAKPSPVNITYKWRAETHLRELKRQARSLERLAAKIEQAEDYPTDAPVLFCRLIRHSVDLIADRLPSAPPEKLPFIQELLFEFGKHLRFSERSRISQTPWSLVQFTESFLTSLTGDDSHFIIRPQWSYNYSISPDFVCVYRRYFEAVEDWIPNGVWEDRIGGLLSKKIYCVSFPRVERLNALMHVNWGHEFGHILAAQWTENHFGEMWKKEEPEITNKINEHLKKQNWDPKYDLLKPVYLKEYAANNIKQTMELARFGLKELISDTVGIHLFGPSALASLNEFSVRYDLDTNPKQCGNYPPWRYRIRNLVEAFAADFKRIPTSYTGVLKPYLKVLQSAELLVSETPDLTGIENDICTQEAYNLIKKNWVAIKTTVINQLPVEYKEPYCFSKKISTIEDLVSRLAQGIPPNETGHWPKTQIASLPDIWNSAWAASYYMQHEVKDWGSPDHYEGFFQLILKGVESSYVNTRFLNKLNLK